RLSRHGRGRGEPGALQGDGAQALLGHHGPGGSIHDRLRRMADELRLRRDLDPRKARDRRLDPRLPCVLRQAPAGFCAGSKRQVPCLVPMVQRNPGSTARCCSRARGREAVLALPCPQSANLGVLPEFDPRLMNAKNIILRPGRTVDAARIAAMSRDLIETGLGWSWGPDRVARSIANKDTSTLLACDRDRVVAFAIMYF